MDPTVLAIPVFLTTMAFEAFVLSRQGASYELKDWGASLSGGLGSLVVKAGLGGLLYAAFYGVWQHRLFDISPGIAAWAALLILEDFTYYVFHRVSHEIRFFWASHAVHHSSERYTLGTALRQSWTEPLVGTIFWLPLAWIGFPPEMIFLQMAVSLLYQYWIHTETIRSLGPLEWVMNTPSHHRVHHGSNPRYLDRNHGGIFIVWDRLFGTFEREDEKVIYGLTVPVNTFHPVRLQVDEYRALWADVWAASTWRNRLRLVFGPPGRHIG